MNQDTAETFLDVEQKAVLGMPHRFEGKILAPYSEGMRLLWINTWERTIGRLAACGLIWMLMRMQEEYDKRENIKDQETRWMESAAAMIEDTEDKARAKAKVIRWAGELGEAKTRAAFLLAEKILGDSNDSDPKSDADASEGEEGGERGNAPASPQPSQPT